MDPATKCLGDRVTSLVPTVSVPITPACSGLNGQRSTGTPSQTALPPGAEQGEGHHQCPRPVCLWWSAWSRQAGPWRCGVGRCSLLGAQLKPLPAAERRSGAGQHLPRGSEQGQSAGLLCNCGVVAARTFSSLSRVRELFLQEHARSCPCCQMPQGPLALGLGAKGEFQGQLRLGKPNVFSQAPSPTAEREGAV